MPELTSDVLIRISATNAANAALGQLHNDLGNLQKKILEVGAAIGGAFALKNVIDTTFRWADGVRLLQNVTGLSAASSSRLAYATKIVGIEADEAALMMDRLAKNMFSNSVEADKGKDAFAKWGIAVHDADGNTRNINDVLIDAAEKVKTFGDGAAATALEMDLFGRSGAKLHELLLLGAEGIKQMEQEADAMGVVLGDTTPYINAERAGRRFDSALDGLRVTLGTALLPLLTDAAIGLTKWVSKTVEAVRTSKEFAGIIKVVGEAFRTVFGIIKSVLDRIGSFIDDVKTLGLGAAIVKLFQDAFSQVPNIFSAFGEMVDATFGANSIAGTAIKAFALAVAALVAVDIVSGLATLGLNLAQVGLQASPLLQVSAAIVLIKQSLDGMKDAGDKVNFVLTLIAIGAGAALLAVGAVPAAIAGVGLLLGTLAVNVTAHWDQVSGAITGALSAIGSMARSVFSTIGDTIKAVFDTIGSVIANAIAAISFDIGPFHLHNGVFTIDQIQLPFGNTIGGGTFPVGGAQPPAGPPQNGATAGPAFVGTTNTSVPITQETKNLLSQFHLGGYASGTDYVPRTGLALLHQGEAVIPADENRRGGNGTTIIVNVSGNITESEDALATRIGNVLVRQLSHIRGVGY